MPAASLLADRRRLAALLAALISGLGFGHAIPAAATLDF
jgi:hypothetical protein